MIHEDEERERPGGTGARRGDNERKKIPETGTEEKTTPRSVVITTTATTASVEM